MSTFDVAKEREKLEGVTPGPWKWFGDTKLKNIYLATTHSGRIYVQDFVRWGMRGAQPRFQVAGIMEDASELVEYEVDYRKDIATINHPDARFIADARTAYEQALDEIERLQAESAGDKVTIKALAENYDNLKAVAEAANDLRTGKTRPY